MQSINNYSGFQKLQAKGLQKTYGRKVVVKKVNIEVNRGEVVGLLGPNGAGKTTTFYMVTGMIRPTKGSVLFDQKEITELPMYKRARMGMGYLAQEPSIFIKLSVEDNLRLVLQITGMTKKEQQDRLEQLLDEFSIAHIRKSKAMMLSGGERRRTEIARALIMNPDFILLDEPFAGIDPIAVEDIQNIIGMLKEKGIGILITDHNVRETLTITDRAYLLYNGSVLKQGSVENLSNDEEVRRLYLGSKFQM
ncbi:MAG: LPS export ABC transporter ATP-binding protein [Candidatus Marinimicrobia bacterium]|nr:LPS export ABC transporter ATP-binding protein [Candidatus Neomarinimicrobiota bacterium]|tara:strand:+ start:390 stop:1139 length:750 start_codon:yes stop_codon:yes gene_type:complete